MERVELIGAQTERQVAARLAVSVAALRAWRLQGRGPRYCRFGRCVRYLPDDVDDYIQASAIGSRSTTADGRESTLS